MEYVERADYLENRLNQMTTRTWTTLTIFLSLSSYGGILLHVNNENRQTRVVGWCV